MNNRTRSFWACALVVALSVTILFPDDLSAFWDKEHLKTAGIIAGISLGVGVAIILIAGTIYDLKKVSKKDSAWFPDPDEIKLFAGAPSGSGGIYFEGTEISAGKPGPGIDLFTERTPREARLLMPPLSSLHDPILIRPRFASEFEAATACPIDGWNRAVAMNNMSLPLLQDR